MLEDLFCVKHILHSLKSLGASRICAFLITHPVVAFKAKL